MFNLPADSPVLIQSGFAMLAIAKISAARNRHPEMIVSLSMSPADDYGVVDANDVGSNGGSPNVTPNSEATTGCYQSNLAPFRMSLLLWFCCAFCSNVSSSTSGKRRSLQLQKARRRRTEASHLKRSLSSGKTKALSAPRLEPLVLSFGSVQPLQQHRVQLTLADELASLFPRFGLGVQSCGPEAARRRRTRGRARRKLSPLHGIPALAEELTLPVGKTRSHPSSPCLFMPSSPSPLE